MKHQTLDAGQTVNYVDASGKTQSGKIAQVYTEDGARIELANGSAIAEWSDGKEPGTFHFPTSETKPASDASSHASSK